MYSSSNKMFWKIISYNFYDSTEPEFDLEPIMTPEEKFKLRAEETQNGILSCSDLELLWYWEEKVQQKEKKMRATFIRRRIVAAIAVAIMSWGAVNTGQAIIGFLSKPTFACPQTKVTLVKGDKIWNIADKFCDGNITDAAGQIMDDNGIEGKDLDSLQPGTVIVINKKGK